MNADKENRPPPGMALEGKKHAPGRNTPGRMRRATQNQYFDVGKVGRKTGVTLPDKGIRDENGIEPMAGIFDSPVKSPQQKSDRTLASSDMNVQESSAPEVHDTVYLSKTPRLPPPRASTPKHTNIGSPKRMSTGRKTQQQPHTTGTAPISQDEHDNSLEDATSRSQPPANRVLDFTAKDTEQVRPSTEITSPFKPKRALRRSMQRQNPFASPAAEARRKPRSESVTEAMKTVDESVLLLSTDDAPIILEGDAVEPVHDVHETEVEVSMEEMDAVSGAELRESGTSSGSLAAELQLARSPSIRAGSPSKKRERASFESADAGDDATADHVHFDDHARFSPEPKKRRSGSRKSDTTLLPEAEQPITVDPSLLSQSGASLIKHPQEPMAPPPRKAPKTKGKANAHQARNPKSANKAPGSPVKLKNAPSRSASPSKRPSSRGLSVGPNFNLRATTPFDDAISTSRFGRPVIKPLQYWANESRIWRNGECEGIIRADEIVKPTAKPKKKSHKKRKQTISRMQDIDEESESESVQADDWEEDLGVISGTVASWDSATQTADSSAPVKDGKYHSNIPPTHSATNTSVHTSDLAFAHHSIITRDVPGSEFKYAKILTLPFFGTGLVEIPPEGFKRAKNSRKMQMVFFVYEGKVLVEIGAPGSEVLVNEFAITKGGVWVVPRGEFSVFFTRVFAFHTRWVSSGVLDLDNGLRTVLEGQDWKERWHTASAAQHCPDNGQIRIPDTRPVGQEAVCATRCQVKPSGTPSRHIPQVCSLWVPDPLRLPENAVLEVWFVRRCSRRRSRDLEADVFPGKPLLTCVFRCRQQLRHYEREPDEDCQDFLRAGVRG
ncbi:mitotic fidelity of chromosome transmission- protein [Friedmanniomyces endolithicus]|nr:mitotic fidelity of chromosome transmission- protein [Friedmanniomyces endolithicus]KAK0281361.1 mitotic fidelity of chromosome transmission- protein [Friedmanniomyces endolithicus]KAK1015273.1 mitotic fidelity of chromosome transmission-related protein [Friedmanniomyces endolithicus]